jgi:acyl-CoA reductase-like NAD-dependent aldehyde dehydrogenase
MKVTHPLKENKRFASIKMIECTSFIDNAFTKATDTSPIPVLNPSTGQQIGSVHSSSKEETFLAIASSKKAFQEWTKFTISKRILILIKFHALIVENQETLIDLICQEHGKTRTEALGEILKGNETLLYAISLPSITGNTAKVSSGVVCRDERLPHGVCLSIVPFNFPYMVPMWTLPICIAMGNTLILKPSEKVPLTMRFVMDLLKKSGLPDGVVNLVNGVRETVELLCDHPDVKCVTFVGTTAVAEQLHLRCRKMNKRVLCLGGAKNHLVAFNDCDIQMCSSDIVASFVYLILI